MAYFDYANAVKRGYIEHLRNMETARQDEYRLYREYYNGVHNTQLPDRLEEFLALGTRSDFTANYCPTVVNAKADRLNVIGFETESEQSDVLWDWWRKNRMDRKQGITHTVTGRDADSFMLIGWDIEADLPRFHFEPAYCDGNGVMVYYSDERRTEIEFASKAWLVSRGAGMGKRRRLNLYFPNRIEKYVSDDATSFGDYMPYNDPDDPTQVITEGYLGQAAVNWFTRDGTENGEPLGVPVVHFKNNDTGDNHGKSDLADVIWLQNAVNKALIDLIANMDTNGFGIWLGRGDTGFSNVDVAPGAIISSSKSPSDVSLERIGGESPDGLIKAYNALVMEIARVSGTPLSYFQTSGQVAAEGTLKQQEVTLLARVKKAQIDYGNGWEQCMMIARRMHNTYSTQPELDESELIETIWDDAETRNDKEMAETLAIHVEKLGVSDETAQRKLGYTDDQIRQHLRAQINGVTRQLRTNARTPAQSGNEDNEQMTQTELTNNDSE